eukprot:1177994-Ditylum_brightwellii.AAC.1
MSARNGFVHDRALANERAGKYMLQSGDKYFAFHYLSVAIQLYSRWGAKAKAEHLLSKHKVLLNEHHSPVMNKTKERRWSWHVLKEKSAKIDVERLTRRRSLIIRRS